jgi:hypothetical protein
LEFLADPWSLLARLDVAGFSAFFTGLDLR